MSSAPWTQEELIGHLQDAVELELYTIPLYLCALYSIVDQSNPAYGLLQETVSEEMLHLELACNVLNALGGQPVLTGSAPPSYPSNIPFILPPIPLDLGPSSLRQTLLFMQVELPSYDDPEADLGPQPDYDTIGAFYDAVEAGLNAVATFPGNPDRQVSQQFQLPNGEGYEDFPVTDLATAQQALTLIVEQGEGTSVDHMDPEGQPAHYYRFAEIASNPAWVMGSAVRNMIYGPAALSYSSNQQALLEFFDGCYSYLLSRLQADFNGDASDTGNSVSLMFSVIQPTILYVVSQVYDQQGAPQFGQNLTPCFRFVDVNFPSLEVVQGLFNALDATDQQALSAAMTALDSPTAGPVHADAG